MHKSEQINELAAALAKAQAEIKSAVKDARNEFYAKGGHGGGYATLASVWEACRIPLSKNGLSVTAGGVFHDIAGWCLETKLMHQSGQWVSYLFPLKPTKDDIQGLKSANTYALRVGLESIAGIPSEDDDDGNAASGKPAVNTKEAAQFVAAQKIEALKSEMEQRKADETKPYGISAPQQKRLYAIAKSNGWSDEDIALQLKAKGYNHSREIPGRPKNIYDDICKEFDKQSQFKGQAPDPDIPF